MNIKKMFLIKWFRQKVLGLKKYKPEQTYGYETVKELKKKYDDILDMYHEDLRRPFGHPYNIFIRNIRTMAITSKALEKKQREWMPNIGYKLNFYEVMMRNNKNEENFNNYKNTESSLWRQKIALILEEIEKKIIEKEKSRFSGLHKDYREKLKLALTEIYKQLQLVAPLSEFDNGIKEVIDKQLKNMPIGNSIYGANLYKLNRFIKNNSHQPKLLAFSEIQDIIKEKNEKNTHLFESNTHLLERNMELENAFKQGTKGMKKQITKDVMKQVEAKMEELNKKIEQRDYQINLMFNQINNRDKEIITKNDQINHCDKEIVNENEKNKIHKNPYHIEMNELKNMKAVGPRNYNLFSEMNTNQSFYETENNENTVFHSQYDI